MLYVDDLALSAETLEGVELMFGEWRQAVERRGLKVNLLKPKVVGEWRMVYGWGGSGGVGANSVLCGTCGKWCPERCSGLSGMSAAAPSRFQCPARGSAEEAVGGGCGRGGEAALLSLCLV